MRKKLILLSMLSIVIIAVLTVCVVVSSAKKEPPPVMFSYLYKYSKYCSIWTIDNEGNIYCFYDRYADYLDMTNYENKRKDEKCKYIKTIDKDVVKEKYDEFQEILSDRHYEGDLFEGREWVTNDERGTRDWYGYTYNWKGEEEHILMHGAGDTQYLSEDSRMKELADWATGMINSDVWAYDDYCRELEAEEYYQEYLKEKQSLEGTGN